MTDVRESTTLVLEWDGDLDTSPYVFVNKADGTDDVEVRLSAEEWRRLGAPTGLTIAMWPGDRVSGADERDGVPRCKDCFCFPLSGDVEESRA